MVNEIIENSLLSSHIQQVVLMYMYINILCQHDNEARFSLYPWDGWSYVRVVVQSRYSSKLSPNCKSSDCQG